MTAEAAPGKPAAAPSRSAGAALAAERERQGLSRADMAQRLHISVSQIEALENSDFSRFPRGPFLRGFTRNYARALGMDAERLVERVTEAAPPADAPDIVVPSQNIRFDPAGHHLANPYVKAAAIAFVLVVLAFAGTYWWLFVRPVAVTATPVRPPAESQPVAAGNLQADATQPAATGGETAKPAEAAQGPATEPPASAAPADPKPAPPAASAAQQAPAATVARAGESTLRLTFRGTAWVEILDASGQSLVSRNHPAGSTGEVYGKPPFRVTIGNAPEVRLSYNGREVDLAPHTKANVARLTLP